MQALEDHVQVQAAIQVDQARAARGLLDVLVAGLVVDVRVAEGDLVTRGQAALILFVFGPLVQGSGYFG